MFLESQYLKSMHVGGVYSKNVAMLTSDCSIFQAAQNMRKQNTEVAIAVNAQGDYLGILLFYSITRTLEILGNSTQQNEPTWDGVHCPTLQIHDESIDSYLVCRNRAVDERDRLLDACQIMKDDAISVVPVLREGRPVGVITALEVVSTLVHRIGDTKEPLDF